MGYFRESVKGVSWMGVLRGLTRSLVYIKIAILARILSPDEFGIFGIASLSLAFLEVFTETGINVFIIQGEGKLKDYIDTAWIVSIIRGVLLSIILLLLSSPVSNFFSSDKSKEFLQLIAMVPLIRGFINPAIVSFRKKLEFKREFSFQSFLVVIDTIVVISVAFLTRSSIALVFSMIVTSFVEVLLSFRIFKLRPRLNFEKLKFQKVVSRGKWITLAGISNYLFENGDDFVVGKLLNTASLGIYQVAYKISTLPIKEVSQTISGVVFPVYSKIAGDKQRLKKACLKVFLVTILFSGLLGLFIFVYSKEIISVVLGNKWLEAEDVLKVLSLFGIVKAIVNISFPVFNSLKKQEYVMWISITSFLGMIVTIFPFMKEFGIVGAGASALFGALLSIPVSIYLFRKAFK